MSLPKGFVRPEVAETTMQGGARELQFPAHARRAYPPFMTGPILMACRNAGDPDAFTEESTTKAGQRRTAQAVAICLMCPLRATCAEWAIQTEQLGVWGATTTAERDRIRQYRAKGARVCLG